MCGFFFHVIRVADDQKQLTASLEVQQLLMFAISTFEGLSTPISLNASACVVIGAHVHVASAFFTMVDERYEKQTEEKQYVLKHKNGEPNSTVEISQFVYWSTYFSFYSYAPGPSASLRTTIYLSLSPQSRYSK